MLKTFSNKPNIWILKFRNNISTITFTTKWVPNVLVRHSFTLSKPMLITLAQSTSLPHPQQMQSSFKALIVIRRPHTSERQRLFQSFLKQTRLNLFIIFVFVTNMGIKVVWSVMATPKIHQTQSLDKAISVPSPFRIMSTDYKPQKLAQWHTSLPLRLLLLHLDM